MKLANYRLLLIAFFTTINFAAIADVNVPSSVSQVTLFQDRAEITRVGNVKLVGGKNVLIFSEIPSTINAESIKVSGEVQGGGKAKIESAEFKTKFIKDPLSDKAKELDVKIRDISTKIEILNQTKERLEHENSMLEGIVLNPQGPAPIPLQNGGVAPVKERSATEIKDLYVLVSEGLKKLIPELVATKNQIQDLALQLEVLQRERLAVTNSGRHESFVTVSLDSNVAGDATIELKYQVNGGAGWTPLYTLDTKSSKNDSKVSFTLDMYASAYQKTGEDWKNVKAIFSTARPSVGLYRPDALPQYLNVYSPPPTIAYRNEMRSLGKAKGNVDKFEETDTAMLADAQAAAPMVEQVAALTTQAGGIQTFKVTPPVTLLSDGSQSKVKLAGNNLSGEITSVVVPAISEQVYREAVIVNTSGASLLPGPISISANGEYLGSRAIDFIPPDGKIKLPVGTNDSILVKRKLLKKYEDDSGIIKSFKRTIANYSIECENISDAPQKLIILEGVPVSQNEKIKAVVTPTGENKPLDEKDTSRIQNDPGILEWHLTIPAKSKVAIGYGTNVEYEVGTVVSGM